MNETEQTRSQHDLKAQVKALQDMLKEAADSIVEGSDTLEKLYNAWEDTVGQLEQVNKELFEDGRALSWVVLLAYFLLGVATGGCTVYWLNSL